MLFRSLQMYYNGQVSFPNQEELRDFLCVTGEYGRSAEARLGVQGTLSISELTGIARKKAAFWHERTSGWMLPRAYIEAAAILARSYEEMSFHLNALSEE